MKWDESSDLHLYVPVKVHDQPAKTNWLKLAYIWNDISWSPLRDTIDPDIYQVPG